MVKLMNFECGCKFCDVFNSNKDKSFDLFNSNEEIAFQNLYFFMQFDRFPVSPGHAVIVSNRHITSILELDWTHRTTLGEFLPVAIQRIAMTDLRKVYEGFLKDPIDEYSKKLCERALASPNLNKLFRDFNIGINEGRNAGRTIDHLHIHIIPRYEGDVPDPVGGVRHIIPGLGNYKNLKL